MNNKEKIFVYTILAIIAIMLVALVIVSGDYFSKADDNTQQDIKEAQMQAIKNKESRRK